MSKEPPYLISVRTVTDKLHNPKYDQEAKCRCGHRYYRHFDTYENMEPVGCKYCDCEEFVEASEK